MRRGVSLREGTGPSTDLLGALDLWAEHGYPALLPIWHRVQVHTVDVPLLRAVRSRGVEPMLYATSTTRRPVVPYESYLAGEQDAKLDAIAEAAADYGHRLIMRWDHEQAMSWAPWGDRDPSLYRDTFDYVGGRMPPNVRMYWCGTKNPNSYRRYFPPSADFIGWDEYSRTRRWQPLRQAWAENIEALRRLSDARIIVGEFGRARALPERRKWIKTLRGVRGVWAAVYFDIDMRATEGVDWRMTRRMRRLYMS